MNKQQLITKYGKKFASTDKNETFIKGVHYAANGSVFATNRHYGLRIKNAHSFEQPLTLDAKTGTPIEGVYPQIERVFPSNYSDQMYIPAPLLDSAVTSVACAEALATKFDKKHPVISLIREDNDVLIKVAREIPQMFFSIHFANMDSSTFEKISLNASYLLTALQLFKDANKSVYVRFNGPLNPFMLTDDGDIDVVIVPYRTNQ